MDTGGALAPVGKQKLVIKFFPQVQAPVFCVGVLPSCDSLHFTCSVFPCELAWGHRTGVVAECRTGLHWDFWFGSSPRDVLNPAEVTSIEVRAHLRPSGFCNSSPVTLQDPQFRRAWQEQPSAGTGVQGLEVPELVPCVGRQV